MNRGRVAAALLLILIGCWYLAVEVSPEVRAFAYGATTWPFQIIGIGALFAVIGLVFWQTGLLIPACIISGIGGMLYWQNLTGNWASWAYMWALIPCFVGIGTILDGALQRRRKEVIGGGWTLFNGLVAFAIFGSFLGGSEIVGKYWPILLIALGVIFLVRAFMPKRN